MVSYATDWQLGLFSKPTSHKESEIVPSLTDGSSIGVTGKRRARLRALLILSIIRFSATFTNHSNNFSGSPICFRLLKAFKKVSLVIASGSTTVSG